MSWGRLFWGGLFVLGGGLLLLGNLGLISGPVRQLFWPLLLILAGGLILLRSLSGGGQMKTESLRLAREEIDTVRLRIEHAVGRLAIREGAAEDELLRGEFVGGVTAQVKRSGTEATVSLSVPSDSWWNLPFGADRGFEWDLELSKDLVYELELETAAGRTGLELGGLNVRVLHLETGASSTRAGLPAVVEHGRVKVESGVASVDLRVPEGVGAHIQSESGLAQIDVDADRFPRRNGAFESGDYASAEHKLDILIQTGVGTVKVR